MGLTSDSSSDNPADPMEIIWEPSDELQNGDFENYDEGGKVKGWDGDYDIGIMYDFNFVINNNVFPNMSQSLAQTNPRKNVE